MPNILLPVAAFAMLVGCTTIHIIYKLALERTRPEQSLQSV